LRAVPEFGAHPRRDVAVDATHSRYFVAHAFGLEDVPDAKVIKPCLVTVAQPARSQAGAQRQPACERDGLIRQFLRSSAPFHAELEPDERAILGMLRDVHGRCKAGQTD